MKAWRAITMPQPRAWLVVNGILKEEYSSIPPWACGPILIHASRKMPTPGVLELWEKFCEREKNPIELPNVWDLERGGIVGAVVVSVGDRGLRRYKHATVVPFRSVPGKVGIWEMKYHGQCCWSPGRIQDGWEICKTCFRVKDWVG